ncbi:uncharacterized protein V1516DRAFT_626233, partial [Lipomyces oligophaga]|uniref:uncharacterized protein n=1 Tax=Lipomyces oligophaga TaxID=45792 RepID=UPI0034CE26FE
ELRGGTLILFLLILLTSFPPFMGYTTVITLAGLVYGLEKGWIISALSTVLSSYLCFVACRAYFFDFAQRLAHGNRNFEALALTLEHGGLNLLWLIRLSPLPFSFSNAALSTIHTITPHSFAIATALSTPKILIPVFIGSRLRTLGDDSVDTTAKIVNVLSIIVSGALAAGTGWIIYHRTTHRAQLLQAELERTRELRAGAVQSPFESGRPSLSSEFDINAYGQGRQLSYCDEPRTDGTGSSTGRGSTSLHDFGDTVSTGDAESLHDAFIPSTDVNINSVPDRGNSDRADLL